MAQDLKEMFAKERERAHSMKEGHEARFLSKLEKELPTSPQRKSIQLFWMRVARSRCASRSPPTGRCAGWARVCSDGLRPTPLDHPTMCPRQYARFVQLIEVSSVDGRAYPVLELIPQF